MAAVVMMVIGLRLMGMGAVMVVGVAESVPVAMEIAVDQFIGEGLSAHRLERLEIATGRQQASQRWAERSKLIRDAGHPASTAKETDAGVICSEFGACVASVLFGAVPIPLWNGKPTPDLNRGPPSLRVKSAQESGPAEANGSASTSEISGDKLALAVQGSPPLPTQLFGICSDYSPPIDGFDRSHLPLCPGEDRQALSPHSLASGGRGTAVTATSDSYMPLGRPPRGLAGVGFTPI